MVCLNNGDLLDLHSIVDDEVIVVGNFIEESGIKKDSLIERENQISENLKF